MSVRDEMKDRKFGVEDEHVDYKYNVIFDIITDLLNKEISKEECVRMIMSLTSF